MRKLLVSALVAFGMLAISCLADALVGSIESEFRGSLGRGTGYCLVLDWASGTNGVVSVDTDPVRGEIGRVVIVPDAPSATRPSNLYDMTIDDEDDVDVLAGQGADLATNASQSVCGGELVNAGVTSNSIPFFVNGKLTVEITNAGSEKGGIIRVYYR